MYKKISLQNGFTILELLIVVAIIGILVAVSFAYLGESRNKGGNAGVQSNLVNARAQAEVFFTNNNRSYEGVCAVVGTVAIGRHVQGAARAYGKTPEGAYADGTASDWDTEACHDLGTVYAVWVPLKESTSVSPVGWCIDSTTASKRVTSVLAGGVTVCP